MLRMDHIIGNLEGAEKIFKQLVAGLTNLPTIGRLNSWAPLDQINTELQVTNI